MSLPALLLLRSTASSLRMWNTSVSILLILSAPGALESRGLRGRGLLSQAILRELLRLPKSDNTRIGNRGQGYWREVL